MDRSSDHRLQRRIKEVYDLIMRCLVLNPDDRIDADELVEACEKLCYPVTEREFGVVRRFDNSAWGFIDSESGSSVFFHTDSVFGGQRLKVGDRVLFARHKGGGSDRAFPVIKLS